MFIDLHGKDSCSADDDGKAQALQRLTRGDCVGVPTETVYGLAADATNGLAVARIFEMKGRPRFNPLICHVVGCRHGEPVSVRWDARGAHRSPQRSGPAR